MICKIQCMYTHIHTYTHTIHSRGSHHNMPCTSTCDGDFTDILIPHTTHEREMGVADRIHLYTCPFTTRNQAIKTPDKVDQAIKQASRDESNDQGSILTIKFLDRHRRWKYRAYSSDYPLTLLTHIHRCFRSQIYVTGTACVARGNTSHMIASLQ